MKTRGIVALIFVLAVLATVMGHPPAQADTLRPVEAPYMVRVESFRVLANGDEVVPPLGRDRFVDYVFGGYPSNTLQAVLVVAHDGLERVSAQITFDGAATPVSREDGVGRTTFRAQITVGPNRKVKVGYRVNVKPRVVTPNPDDSPFDPEIGLTLSGANGLRQLIHDHQSSTATSSRPGCSCCEAMEKYFTARWVGRFFRKVGVNVATNLVDLALATMGGGPIADATKHLWEARAGASALRRWLREYIVQAIEGAIWNFFKAVLTEIITNGRFIMADVPREIGKDFINGFIGAGVGEGGKALIGDLKRTMPNFLYGKIGDAVTDGVYDAAGAQPHPEFQRQAEALSQKVQDAAAEAQAEMERRGLSADYFKAYTDDYEMTVQGRRHRIRVYGVQWLVTGRGSILMICDPLPAGSGQRKGYLIRFQGSAGGLRGIGGGNGVTEFNPTTGQTYDPEALTREVMGQ